MSLFITLPYPPSVNHYYRHVGSRVLISREGRHYREHVDALVGKGLTEKGKLSVKIEMYPPDLRRRDVDNIAKCLLDALTFAEAYEDDSQIYELIIQKREPIDGGIVHIWIEPWNSERTNN